MNISVTNILQSYHKFDREFWLDYKTLEKIHPMFDMIKHSLLKTKRVEDSYFQDIDKATFEMERALLDAEWKNKNEEAKLIGTSTHEYIRNLFCTNLSLVKSEFLIDTDLYKVQQYEHLKNTLQGCFIETKLELPIECFNLVGIPDCFIIDNGYINVYDWKTGDKIKFKSTFDVGKGKTKKMKYPLSKLDDCEGIKYQLQVSIYMWMLLLIRPDLRPGTLNICWILDNKLKKTFQVEYLQDVVEKLIPWHVNNLKLELKLDECNELKY